MLINLSTHSGAVLLVSRKRALDVTATRRDLDVTATRRDLDVTVSCRYTHTLLNPSISSTVRYVASLTTAASQPGRRYIRTLP